MKLTQSITIPVTFNFKARGELSDYGVDRSPTWVELTEEEFEDMEFNNVIYSYDDLVADFGQHGADGIVQIGRDNLIGEDWV